MVDTGASTIALRESSAARLGIYPRPRDYTAGRRPPTASPRPRRCGSNRVEVNGITVRDVEAVVMPDEALERRTCSA